MSDPLRLNPRAGIHVDSHVLHTVDHSPIQGILAFLNLSIDDVIDNPIARTAVHYHWRIHHLVLRRCAAVEADHIRARAAAGVPMATDNLEEMTEKSQKRL